MATIRDVAREAGVSVATVSYVLNKTKPVSAETRRKVLAAVRKLGYHPSNMARGLRSQRAYSFGYSWRPMPDGQINIILDTFLEHMAIAAARHDYHIVAYPTSTTRDELSFYQTLIEARRVDGFILSNTNYDDVRIDFLLDAHVPFVAFGRANPEWEFPWIDVDGAAGIRKGVEHLVEVGHTRIAFIAWPEGSLTGDERLRGYLEGMAAHGLPVDEDWIVRGRMSHEVGYEAARTLMALPPERRPTAIMAVTDIMAIGVMNALADMDIQVGRDVAVMGFDDIPMAAYLRPPLTTLRQPIARIGEHIIMMLLACVEEEALESQHILMAPELIVRASTSPETSHPTYGVDVMPG